MSAKYQSFDELVAAFASGALRQYVLVLDKDRSYLSFIAEGPEEVGGDLYERWEWRNAKNTEAEKWFVGPGCDEIRWSCVNARIPFRIFGRVL